jgi:ATP-dependent helicase HrpA
VAAKRAEIKAALADNQVVIVAGETGSGKTTQLAKMCLELGRGRAAMIGHTQPRRIAARSVAERLAEELKVPLGGAVGYAVRFDDRVSPATMVKVMTDGVLLAEVRRDRLLRAYDTIIVDEAHERSLNVDFLVGYLTRILPRRPDLKLIVTSATIDTYRFASHFDAPVIEVSGRSYPIQIRYRPPGGPLEDSDLPSGSGTFEAETSRARTAGGAHGSFDKNADINEAICDAVGELCATGPGDVLVFVPGERDIRDATEALRSRSAGELEILPLYSRLSTAESHKVFRPHDKRRVVVATNVAETSLTVPGIRFVVDTGLARISRFSHRSKVQRLPIEAISRASADQRAGRCGRVAPGICVRLYSREDYLSRAEYTDPEILRTNLASVLLTMITTGLGAVEDFPFMTPPDRRSISDARGVLQELGAIEHHGGEWRVTPVGRRMARLPLDPRLARMVVEGDRLGCLREVTVIAAALSIQDPREVPADERDKAQQMHSRFDAGDSDFLGLLRLWEYLSEVGTGMSGNAFRRRCRAEFLNVLRVREWQDLVSQIRQAYRAEGLHANSAPAPSDSIHRAMLPGLLSNVGRRDRLRRDYQGTRNTRWRISRASCLAKRSAPWVLAGSLVETEGIWAHSAAAVQPSWVEAAGSHLAQRSYGDALWDASRGEAFTTERVTILGLVVVDGRRAALARVDPAEARRLLIYHALIEGESPLRLSVLEDTRKRIAALGRLADRLRRRDVYAGDDALQAFYDTILPADVTGTRRLERWWRHTKTADFDPLRPPLSVIVDPEVLPLRLSDYPDWWETDGLRLRLRYRYAPGEADDGVTVQTPLVALNRLDAAAFEGHIPGLRRELVRALIHLAPKSVRRSIAGTDDTADMLIEAAETTGDVSARNGRGFLAAIAEGLSRISGEAVTLDMFDLDRLPGHLRVGFEVIGVDGSTLCYTKDLAAAQQDLTESFLAAARAQLPGVESSGLVSWELDDLPDILERDTLRVFPGLVDEGLTVGVRLFASRRDQALNMWQGTRRLLQLTTPPPVDHIERRLPKDAVGCIRRAGTSPKEVIHDAASALVDDALIANGGPTFRRASFELLAAQVSEAYTTRLEALVRLAASVYRKAVAVEAALTALESSEHSGRLTPSLSDVRRQLRGLVFPGFITVTGTQRVEHLPRYLDAASRRLELLPGDLRRDQARQAVTDRLTDFYEKLLDSHASAALAEARWMIEELRVSLWAQPLGTAVPVSEERIWRALRSAAPPSGSMVGA